MGAIRAFVCLALAITAWLWSGGGVVGGNTGRQNQPQETGAAAVSIRYNGILRGANVTPPVKTNGLGTAQLALTGNELMWVVSFYGLESPPTGVFIHAPGAGPAAAETPPLFDLGPDWKAPGRNNWLLGKTTLSAAQITDLNAGKWYLTVRTETHPQGEISGQFKLFE